MTGQIKHLCVLAVLLAVAAQAQQPGPPAGAPPVEQGGPGGNASRPPPPMQRFRGPMDRAMHVGPPGRWWNDAALAEKLGLTGDQQKKMDDLFLQNRLKLIDLSAALQKEEVILEPLLSTEHPEESKILTQIDRIAQARAELEKANARMLLGIRSVLTQDQWKRLQAEAPGPRMRGPVRQ